MSLFSSLQFWKKDTEKEAVKLGVIINFCSNDYRFIRPAIENVSDHAQRIIVPYCERFFDGSPENEEIIQRAIKENPKAEFVAFPFEEKMRTDGNYGHNLARHIGYNMLKGQCNYLMFLDTDEIADKKAFNAWMADYDLNDFDGLTFASYWYFYSPENQAQTLEESAMIIKTAALQDAFFFHRDERKNLLVSIKGKKKKFVKGKGEQIVFHHYSWVRTREQMLKKVQSWGHKSDKDWVSLVNELFDHGFTGKDFVHDYKYNKVKPLID